MTKVSTMMAQPCSSDYVGLDLSDRTGTYVVLSSGGQVVGEGKLDLTQRGLERVCGAWPAAKIAIEVGGHSPWVSRELSLLGHTVTVANPRQLKLVHGSTRKSDRLDAENLARLLRYDPVLLHPIQHRDETAQADLALLRSRDLLIRTRTKLINSVRSMVKAQGSRLPRCSTPSFHHKVKAHLPAVLKPALEPTLQSIAVLTEQIRGMDRQLAKLAEERYPQTRLLRTIKGVGVITALAYVLTLGDPGRFRNSRSAGAFLGLTTRQYDSGDSQPQLHISKAGDDFLRRLTVQSAQYILGPFGQDSELRRWGKSLTRGGNNKILKRKAVVAVARKLAVLMHKLWLNGEVYEPFYEETRKREAA